jgi:hypothetical protein
VRRGRSLLSGRHFAALGLPSLAQGYPTLRCIQMQVKPGHSAGVGGWTARKPEPGIYTSQRRIEIGFPLPGLKKYCGRSVSGFEISWWF